MLNSRRSRALAGSCCSILDEERAVDNADKDVLDIEDVNEDVQDVDHVEEEVVVTVEDLELVKSRLITDKELA